jgi:hypothetical protein
MKKANQSQVNQIVRAIRSMPPEKRNFQSFAAMAMKEGRNFNIETCQAVMAGLKDAERAALSSRVFFE